MSLLTRKDGSFTKKKTLNLFNLKLQSNQIVSLIFMRNYLRLNRGGGSEYNRYQQKNELFSEVNMNKGLILRTKFINNQVQIFIPNGFKHIVEDNELVQNIIKHFYRRLEKIDDNKWDDIVRASDNIQNALFPHMNILGELFEIFENYDYIKIVSDKKSKHFLNIPWELLHIPSPNNAYLGQKKFFKEFQQI
ncbi:MAG: hypothetical protein OMM_05240 [Candidatus Magnetoglobus multicellularis str. Araruama]|uniref:Uncharacterized protein n=1 Tax=Candidatus Magnetoglobus multicellularis str. Araruama TaxID=890399 RepID=A0A1V1NXK5_9BACT|nr:MAG: hypothetical protein OMM_05240 [Candidatus Magnetoglobus multicellularis str. Araruama]